MRNDLAKILLGEEEIQKRVRELGAELARDYVGLEPTLVCILKGAVMFYADLCRAIPIQVNMDFMAVSSYGNRTKSSGEVEIRKDLSRPIDGRHVIIVEDIMDSGFTLSYLSRVLASRGAASVKICTLLDKPERTALSIREGRTILIHDRQRVCRRLRARLRGAVPQPALYRRIAARNLRK